MNTLPDQNQNPINTPLPTQSPQNVTPPPSIPPLNTEPSRSAKPKDSLPHINWIPFILSLFVFALFMIGTGFVLARFLSGQPILSIKTSPTPTTIPITIPTPDPTANMKTLESIYGYTLKYPSNWFVSLATKDRLGSVDQIESSDAKVEIGPQSNLYNLEGVEEFFSLNGIQFTTKEKTTIGGNPAIKVIGDSPAGKYTTYYVEKGYPNVYHISIYGDLTGGNQEKIDQILSTFKFLETTKLYDLSGSFKQTVTPQDTDDFNKKLQPFGVSATILEIFPPKFNITGLTQEKCTQIRNTITTLTYLTNISPCEQILNNPSQNPDTPVSATSQTEGGLPQ